MRLLTAAEDGAARVKPVRLYGRSMKVCTSAAPLLLDATACREAWSGAWGARSSWDAGGHLIGSMHTHLEPFDQLQISAL
jgi:hypothetical protein